MPSTPGSEPQDPGPGQVGWGLSASPALPGRPPRIRGPWQSRLTMWMGGDSQGEISSSVESLLFKAAHKMSSPPCSACDVLLSRRI